jgi:hypothetical protein
LFHVNNKRIIHNLQADYTFFKTIGRYHQMPLLPL